LCQLTGRKSRAGNNGFEVRQQDCNLLVDGNCRGHSRARSSGVSAIATADVVDHHLIVHNQGLKSLLHASVILVYNSSNPQPDMRSHSFCYRSKGAGRVDDYRVRVLQESSQNCSSHGEPSTANRHSNVYPVNLNAGASHTA